MSAYTATGRVFLGTCLVGIGILHLIFPGIRPIIVPDSTHLAPQWNWIAYVIAASLIAGGIYICINTKPVELSLILALSFFMLFLFAHLPAYLSVQGMEKLKYWVNLNKTLALTGGFLILASVSSGSEHRFFKIISIVGRCFFAIMLFLFGIGHLLSTTAMSAMVPAYIPFAKFWTFLGGLILVFSAISFCSKLWMRQFGILLAATLFIWLITLHLFYAIQFPTWSEGEHWIGSLSCLGFCGISLLISQSSKPVKLKV